MYPATATATPTTTTTAKMGEQEQKEHKLPHLEGTQNFKLQNEKQIFDKHMTARYTHKPNENADPTSNPDIVTKYKAAGEITNSALR